MNANIAKTMLQFIHVSSGFGKKAMDTIAVQQREKQAAEVKVAGIVDTLITKGVLAATEKSAAITALGNHAATLDVLANTADMVSTLKQEKAASALGRGVSETGNTSGRSRVVPGSLDSPFVGARTSEKKASDDALIRGLGLNF